MGINHVKNAFKNQMFNKYFFSFYWSNQLSYTAAQAIHLQCSFPGSIPGSLQRVSPMYVTMSSLPLHLQTTRHNSTRTETPECCHKGTNSFPSCQVWGSEGSQNTLCAFNASLLHPLLLTALTGGVCEDTHQHQRTSEKNELNENWVFTTIILAET